ncbi:MAG: RecX family transcriptional regulator [Candidatus Marinimicrobia bacterium]|nr:RecX family transcriptional regulator [Candidatus Neomarinimicrobiota bacterium]
MFAYSNTRDGLNFSKEAERIVTKISTQKKRTDRRSIFLDGEYSFSVCEETFRLFPIETGKSLSEKQITIIKTHEEFEKAKELALRYLIRRMRSEYELTLYLRKKEITEKAVKRSISYCKERKYINDEEYASMLVRDMINLNCYGINKIRLQLRRRGLSSEIIKNVLENQIHDSDQLKNAFELAKKKMRTIKDQAKAREKIYRFLQQRGFNYSVINQVLKDLQ